MVNTKIWIADSSMGQIWLTHSSSRQVLCCGSHCSDMQYILRNKRSYLRLEDQELLQTVSEKALNNNPEIKSGKFNMAQEHK